MGKAQGSLEYTLLVGGAVLIVLVVAILISGLSQSQAEQTVESSQTTFGRVDETLNNIPDVIPGRVYLNDNFNDNDLAGWTYDASSSQEKWTVSNGVLQGYFAGSDNNPNVAKLTRQLSGLTSHAYTMTAEIYFPAEQAGLIAGGVFVRRYSGKYQIMLGTNPVATSGPLDFGKNWKITWVPDNGGTLNLGVDGQKISWVTGKNTGLPNSGEFGFGHKGYSLSRTFQADNVTVVAN